MNAQQAKEMELDKMEEKDADMQDKQDKKRRRRRTTRTRRVSESSGQLRSSPSTRRRARRRLKNDIEIFYTGSISSATGRSSKKEVVNKFSGLDKAMDELRMGQAEAASVADTARRAVKNLAKTNRGGVGGKGGGGAPTEGGVTKEDLDKMLEGVETRLTKFVVTEVGKLQDRPPDKNEEKLPRRSGWNARQEDTGALVEDFPLTPARRRSGISSRRCATSCSSNP